MSAQPDIAALAPNLWRANIHTFAATVSEGAWQPWPYLVFVSRMLQLALTHGWNLILNGPPRHGKSELTSVWFPAWVLHLFPELKIILTTNESALAQDFSMRVRDIVTRLGGNTMNDISKTHALRLQVSARSQWKTIEGGGMRAAGVNKNIIGHGGNILLADDLYSSWQDVSSEAFRHHLRLWMQTTFLRRAEPRACVILTGTRWREDDVYGWLQDEMPGRWLVINMQAIAGEFDPMGRAPGEALCPERYTIGDLLQMRLDMGTAIFNAQYQGDVSMMQAAPVIRTEWIRYAKQPPHDRAMRYLGVDPAISEKSSADYSGLVGIASHEGEVQIELAEHARLTAAALEDRIVELHEANGYDAIGVEDVAWQRALWERLRKRGLPAVLSPVRGDKRARVMMTLQPGYERGSILHARKLPDLEHELLAFPNKQVHDDLVDAAEIAVRLSTGGKPKVLVVPSGLDSFATGASAWRLGG